VVEKEDVNEAMRLMEMSKESLNPAVEHTRFVLLTYTDVNSFSAVVLLAYFLS